MSESEPSVSNPGLAVEGEQTWDDLPESTKVQALARATAMLAERGHPPFNAEEISEYLGSAQVRLLSQVLIENGSEDIAQAAINEGITEDDEFISAVAEVVHELQSREESNGSTEPDSGGEKPELPEDSTPPEGQDTMDSSKSSRDEIIDEVNKRVVAPLVLGTGLFLLAAGIGALYNGSLIIFIIVLPAIIASAWAIWRMSNGSS